MGKHQEHRILKKPRNITDKDRIEVRGGAIIEANEKKFIESTEGKQLADIIFGAIFLLSGLWIIYPFDDFFTSDDFHWTMLFLLLYPFIGLLLLIKGVFTPKKYSNLNFDRLNGIISYPATFFGKPLEGPFNELKVVFAVSGAIDGYSPQEYLKVVNTFRPKIIDLLKTISYQNPYVAWSFMVWYMDKNRPLPPCEIFDPYRRQDFERRKAEGFLRPLYPSNIPTPEATPEQQAEREKIGGW
ncbi:hypothetical protein I2486_19735 [Cellulophaga sp. E16_2]|uniref:hypothetical protein n=1 Tax=Cellulophaga sp. E16_2 TaxID=2789297 RepID=UPI001A91047A|nr:hypothetical protein [Cellulophaga sp. E16_2]MBO0593636.1 hypothetical protein [Cellulophaga sp. E16_2]